MNNKMIINTDGCLICESKKLKSFVAEERMFGIGEEFRYAECLNCGSLHLCDIPDDYSKYYGKDYYSMKIPKAGFIKRILKKKRFDYSISNKYVIGAILTKFFGRPPMLDWLEQIDFNFSDKILDIGCGSGRLIYDMRNLGFLELTGIDLYIEKDVFIEKGFRILKKSINDIESEFDLIMLHHSFEHMLDPLDVLKKLKSKLKKDSTLLIRIPLSDSEAWKIYGTFWVGLDAPRHAFLCTKKGMQILADKAGYKILKIIYDSTGVQFWASEQYKRGISLNDPKSYSINPSKSIFTSYEIKNFEKQAKYVNRKESGDQACFLLKKID